MLIITVLETGVTHEEKHILSSSLAQIYIYMKQICWKHFAGKRENRMLLKLSSICLKCCLQPTDLPPTHTLKWPMTLQSVEHGFAACPGTSKRVLSYTPWTSGLVESEPFILWNNTLFSKRQLCSFACNHSFRGIVAFPNASRMPLCFPLPCTPGLLLFQ